MEKWISKSTGYVLRVQNNSEYWTSGKKLTIYSTILIYSINAFAHISVHAENTERAQLL